MKPPQGTVYLYGLRFLRIVFTPQLPPHKFIAAHNYLVPVDHYENFPVASILLPRHLRRPVELIYAFARQADDFADEGELLDGERLRLLDSFRTELRRIEAGAPSSNPLFNDLAIIMASHHLPISAFYDLLDAFSQDVVKKRYENFGEVMEYCRRSANPVGRLLLHLYGQATPQNLAYSDKICSSLQIINFLQDIEIDLQKDRIYMPQDDMAKFGLDEDAIARKNTGGPWSGFMQFQIDRVRAMLESGAPLGWVLKGRVGLEMRMIIAGGLRILEKIQRKDGDIFKHRPVLRAADWGVMLYRSLIPGQLTKNSS